MKESELEDLRRAERFIADPPIPGTFGGVEISISDLGETGIQAKHERPMKLGTTGKLSFTVETTAVSVPARVVWSQLSGRPDAKGKLFYRSGIRLEHDDDAARQFMRSLVEMQRLRPDATSLQRKRDMLTGKAKALASQPRIKPITVTSGLDPDILLLVQQARERLQTHPDEAMKWYNRARYTIAEIGAQRIHHREDVVAIWESLERTIDLEMIARALTQLKK
ncbi:MAG TPA: PilZ domain-containing protein [Thermoanaerobaculia bacterium]